MHRHSKTQTWQSRLWIRGLLILAAMTPLVGCPREPVTRRTLMLPSECDLLPAPAKTHGPVTLALPQRFDPEQAPWARNASERILFRHLYETLLTVDCLGRVGPGLAESWKKEDGGRRWVFTVRGGARFWDGVPVTAREVVDSWHNAAVDLKTLGVGIDSAVASGTRSVAVYFDRRHAEVPRLLSAPAFAVARRVDSSRGPIGSGPYRLTGIATAGEVTVAPAFGREGAMIRFVETSPGDPRNALDDLADIMITADPVVIEYAQGLPDKTVAALPWDRAYVLVSPRRIWKMLRRDEPEQIPYQLANRLARDAVRSDAVGCRPPFWWADLDGCRFGKTGGVDRAPGETDASEETGRIVYEASDPVARDLAERIVALAGADPDDSPDAAAVQEALSIPRSGLTAAATPPAVMEASLRAGADVAYIVSIPRRPYDPCVEARRLLERIPWLEPLADHLSEALIPLVDTRWHAIASPDRVGLVVDGYGNVLVVQGTPEGGGPP